VRKLEPFRFPRVSNFLQRRSIALHLPLPQRPAEGTESVQPAVRVYSTVFWGLLGFLLGVLLAVAAPVSWAPGLGTVLLATLIGAAVGYWGALSLFLHPARRLRKNARRVPTWVLVGVLIGLTAGFFLGFLLAAPLAALPGGLGRFVPTIASLALGVLGAAFFLAVGEEFYTRLGARLFGGSVVREKANGRIADHPIILDTSAIIDGRIADVTQSGFLQGKLVIPRFILEELRHIADSSDPQRRNRGRRGLEMLNRLRREAIIPVEVIDTDPEGLREVDDKLVAVASLLNGPIVTTDFNLNRVAEIQGVSVLNVNLLANALRPVVIPGEELHVYIQQEGKEHNQGLAFLEDGTMIVVEGGRRFIGHEMDVVVTRVLQTAAGRIIFSHPKDV
jgi:uncharacterized protein YacL